MIEPGLLFAVVDDDPSIRESLPDLLIELGFSVHAFSSAGAFLASGRMASTRCLIANVAMPDMTGFELLRKVRARGRTIPVIFMTAQEDDAIRRTLMEGWAVIFLFKPFSEETLIHAIDAALGRWPHGP